MKNRYAAGDRQAGQITASITDWQKLAAQEAYECPEHKGLHSSPAKTELKELIKSRANDQQSVMTFRSFMCDFERRYKDNHQSLEEVDKTYKQISRLLEKRGTGYTSEEERLVLAKQILENAAYPSPIFQGQHNTCAPSTFESRMLSRNPSDAARLIADAALTGKTITPDGQSTSIPAINLRPDRDSSVGMARDGIRSYASQIYQSTIPNVFWQSQPKPVSSRYVQMPHAPNSSGELLQSKVGSNWVTAHDDPHLAPIMYRYLYEKITGPKKENGCFVIERRHPADNRPDGLDMVTVISPEQLQAALHKMKDQFPIIVSVHTGNEPFFTDSNHATPDWHSVLLTDIDSQGNVTVPSSWLMKQKRKMHVNQLFECMRPKGSP